MATASTNPADDIRQQVDSLRFKINGLHDQANLKSAIDRFTDLDSLIQNFPIRISRLRQQNYVFDPLLEKTAASWSSHWSTQKPSIQAQISIQSSRLQSYLQSLEIRFNSFAGSPAASAVQMMNSELSQFEDQCTSTANAIDEMFADIKNDMDKFNQQLADLEYSMDRAETASFGFLPTESMMMAVKAVWCKNGKEEKSDPEGVLFLTDQRILFEQNEDVATKKVLFVTTETKKVQQLLFEVPVFFVSDAEGSKLGLFKNIDMLKLSLASGSFSDQATLHLFNQSSEEWQKIIIKAKNHEFDSNRVVPLDQAIVEKTKSAPTKCPQCGGAITQPVLRGMDTITCEFCGAVIRL